ncbi:vWA domain-containing protein [Hymenobacter sp. BRD67]|uniref:vWA domain-containing protein n=1 Tax=Hymenobacter sp. BRD67 TaxID=2675877 RepID=UPI001564A51E|nr:VWA domain-containing protein [Hymenobacter sp. BRD67]QKG54252.1 von Willebrand factor type A domain-containing protein [Hymenobacter sp. BRD67]
MKKMILPLLLALGPALVSAAQQTGAPVLATAATCTVSGRVTDVKGAGLPGVTVLVKGTALGTSTDQNGQYMLAGVPGKGKLVFSFVGYVTQEKPVSTDGKPLNVVLPEDQKSLNEVVVIGYGAAQKQSVTGSVATVSAVPQALQGRAAGVQIRGAASNPRKTARFAPPVVAYDQAVLPARPEAGAGDTYARVEENKFLSVGKEPLSSFSLDVDNASYTNVRRFLNEGQLPPRDAVRVEEMLNYFHYQLPAPAAASPDPVRISAELSECPWAAGHQLARIGIQAKKMETASLPPANLVFLVDVSGSMDEPDRLPLVQAGLKLLVRQLRPQDHVALVAYAGAAGLVLPPTAGSRQADILEAIDRLQAGGSTAGGAGLRLAYAVAQQSFQKESNNRVILATDGDFNVGESSEAAMEQLIVEQRETGVFLTVLGVGRGNLRDSRMELLADKGNGNYAYLDNLDEARRTLVAQFGGTLFTVAKDVKLQVEFNPARVASYRLIGYENRLLANEDFNNDRKDAGELGAGHTVTALYELVPVGSASPLVDGLKYQPPAPTTPASPAAEVLTVKLRYKEPQGLKSKLLAQPLAGAATPVGQASADQQFAAAVAEFGLLLRQSEQSGATTWATAIHLAEAGRGPDPDGYRAELVRLLKLAEGLAPVTKPLGVR